jgi:hypothetical protein
MKICEHMEVVDANDQHVGTVEKVEGDRITLIKKDALDPQHPFLDRSQVACITPRGLIRVAANINAFDELRFARARILHVDVDVEN